MCDCEFVSKSAACVFVCEQVYPSPRLMSRSMIVSLCMGVHNCIYVCVRVLLFALSLTTLQVGAAVASLGDPDEVVDGENGNDMTQDDEAKQGLSSGKGHDASVADLGVRTPVCDPIDALLEGKLGSVRELEPSLIGVCVCMCE